MDQKIIFKGSFDPILLSDLSTRTGSISSPSTTRHKIEEAVVLIFSGWMAKENFTDVFEGDSRAPPSHTKGFAAIWTVTELNVPIHRCSVNEACSWSRVHGVLQARSRSAFDAEAQKRSKIQIQILGMRLFGKNFFWTWHSF